MGEGRGEGRWEIHFSQTFEVGLERVGLFLIEADAVAALERLMDDIETVVAPNLRKFPSFGRPFLRRAPRSARVIQLLEALGLREAEGLREYLHGDYLILYSLDIATRQVLLHSIRHGRELGYRL